MLLGMAHMLQGSKDEKCVPTTTCSVQVAFLSCFLLYLLLIVQFPDSLSLFR